MMLAIRHFLLSKAAARLLIGFAAFCVLGLTIIESNHCGLYDLSRANSQSSFRPAHSRPIKQPERCSLEKFPYKGAFAVLPAACSELSVKSELLVKENALVDRSFFSARTALPEVPGLTHRTIIPIYLEKAAFLI